MAYTTLITTEEFAARLHQPNWVVFDCRFRLNDPGAGRRDYNEGHIPGARYAHLDDDLAASISPTSGRHPLPEPKVFAQKLGDWGVGNRTQVIVYDDTFGAIAARMWWLLRWLGHESCALLDGGFPKWKREKRPVTSEMPRVHSVEFTPYVNDHLWVRAAFVEEAVQDQAFLVLDARADERFRGDVEPLDRIAGHIPGALNATYEDNLAFGGEFLSPGELRERYLDMLAGVTPDQVVHMCGSGVTACHSILAMEHAGLAGSKLYAGSWSEWITDPKRPVTKDG
jgi:thiosulfate/3-mercaptopyruvate sulfurtransferase